MKKLFILLIGMLCSIGMWADTQSYTVSYEFASMGGNVSYSKFYRDKTAAMGNWCNRWEVRGDKNLTAFSLNIPGASIISDDYCISGWDSKLRNNTTYNTFTIQAIGTGIVTGYTITALVVDARTDKTDDFTKTIQPAKGGDAVTWTTSDNSSKTVTVTGLTENSATFALMGTTNGEVRLQPSSFQMTMELTLLNSNSDIDVNKYYYIACPRGGLSTNSGQLASTFKNDSYTMKPFVFVESGGNYYLYSLEDNKYVSESGALTDTQSDAIEINTTGKNSDKYPTYLKIGTKYLRTSNYQTTYGANTGSLVSGDAGNYYAIVEGGSLKQYYKDRIDAYHGLGGITSSGIDAKSGFAAIYKAYTDAIEKVEGKFFKLQNYGVTSKYLYVTGSNVTTTETADDALVQFRFTPENGSLAILGGKNQKYVGATSQSTQATAVDSPVDYEIEYDNVKGFAFHYVPGNYRAYLHCAASQSYNVVGWSTDAGATWWSVTEVDAITYILKENDEEFLRSSRGTTVGATITALPADLQRVFTNYTYPVASLTTVAGANEYVANIEFTMPFTASTDYASAKWYYMTMRTTKYAVYGESAPYALNTTQDLTANGMWAFIGNPYTGIKVINKAAGDGKYLQATNTQPSMTTTPTSWTIGNTGGNFTLYESSVGYIHDISGAGRMKYWTSSSAAGDDGSVFRVEEAEPTIVISKATGTYYLSNGTAISNPDETESYWGPTWKSTRTIGANNLLTLTTSSGMNARNSDIYTGAEGAVQRYTLTAAAGYIITGYSVAGTANSTDVTITPRIRKSLTIEKGNSGTLSVSDLDLKTTSFTLSGANSTQGSLSSVTLSVTLKPTATISYTPPVENNTTATIGYKHVATSASRYMTYMKDNAEGVVSANQVSSTFDLAPSTAAGFIFEYNSDLRAYYIKETSTSKYVYAKDDLTWAEGSRNTTTNVAALGVDDLPSDDEGKTIFQWTIDDGGTSVGLGSYYIRPKSNTNTAISVQSQTAGILGFYDLATKNYDFAHASLITWEQQVGFYYTTERNNNVMKAGKIGYPKTTSTEYTNLFGHLSTFIGGHTYTKSDYTQLISYYDAYYQASDIVTPPAGFYKVYHPLSSDGTKKYVTVSGNVPTSTVTVSDEASAIWYYTGERLIAYSNGYQVKGNASGNETMVVGGKTVAFKKSNVSGYGFGFMNVVPSECSPWYVSPDKSDFVLNRWSGGLHDGQQFQVEGVTSLPVTFNSAALGYATFNSPVALIVPKDNVKAYVCKIDGNKIKMYYADQLKDGDNWILPENTPVLLYNSDYTNTPTVNLTITSDTDEEYENNGFNKGTVAAETPDADNNIYYALRKLKSGTVGFYQRADQSAALTGFRAWIEVSKASPARNFTIEFDGDSDPTGIVEALGLEDANVEIYDLNGRKLSEYRKGINIVNGKKVFK